MSLRPGLQDRFNAEMGRLLGPDFPSDIGLAVSGGGDSMAMLYLAHNWTREFGVRLWVVTVDHGLREGSVEEAEMVAEECVDLGWPHATLRWRGWSGSGNLMAAARQARLELIDRWREGITHVLFAHTGDDVAETFLMRLKRGSGVDGLAGMSARQRVMPFASRPPGLGHSDMRATKRPPQAQSDPGSDAAPKPGFWQIRPLLGESRESLRFYLETLQGRWVDDPTNEDDRFERARLRKALGLLEKEGLYRQSLVDAAGRMARARDALRSVTAKRAERIVLTGPLGCLLVRRDPFRDTEEELRYRLLSGALMWVSGAIYPPRSDALEDLVERVLSGGGGTLHGCDVRIEPETIRISREANATLPMTYVPGEDPWDNRWHIVGPSTGREKLRALGADGYEALPDKTAAMRPLHALQATPSIWRDGKLVAAPLAGLENGWKATLIRPSFVEWLRDH